MNLRAIAITAGMLASVSLGSADLPNNNDLPTGSKYMKLDVEKWWGDSFASARRKLPNKFIELEKRDNDYVSVEINNKQTYYSVDLHIGTPPQQVTVLVDTGSGDLWVVGAGVYCGPNYSPTSLDCMGMGAFNTSSSSSWKGNNTEFSISYADATYASGEWGVDTLRFGDLHVDGLTFAVANATNSSTAVLGIGLPGIESTNLNSRSLSDGYTYDNLPVMLKRDGVIAKNAYSLFTNQLTADSGSVLFGGVDHKKYSGQLLTLPIVNTYPGLPAPVELAIALDGIGYSTDRSRQTIVSTSFAALLDSGTTFSYFPVRVAEVLADAVGARWSSRAGAFLGRCTPESNSAAFDFNFGGARISVPISNFILQTRQPGLCAFSFFPHSRSIIILGDVFLSSAYVVYDLENYEISLAQATYDSSEEIEPIISTVPRAVRASGYSATLRPGATPAGGGDVYGSDESTGVSTRSRSEGIFVNGGQILGSCTSIAFSIIGLLSVII
ncbi:HBR083Cp [Eremothecium sinecaudum]|uniref:HBR083Cp n=1 Tax=Eremothecium sinecaudum TaxID=45286 RepID=A0A109UWU9_9SACH|nr:HBR083Cp [Eremothecium sinecaudum]AMD18984.1 HBR083Cp [Eremothecium sinecaudum]